MIALLRQLIWCVTAAALFGSVALSLVREGALRQIVRIAVGLVLVLSLAAPFQRGLSLPDWSDWLTGGSSAQEEDAAALYRETLCAQAERETESYIEQLAAEEGIDCTVEVSAEIQEDGTLTITAVTLRAAQGADDTFRQELAGQLGISADAVTTDGSST